MPIKLFNCLTSSSQFEPPPPQGRVLEDENQNHKIKIRGGRTLISLAEHIRGQDTGFGFLRGESSFRERRHPQNGSSFGPARETTRETRGDPKGDTLGSQDPPGLEVTEVWGDCRRSWIDLCSTAELPFELARLVLFVSSAVRQKESLYKYVCVEVLQSIEE